jgi:hypothetical protein
MPDMTLAAKKKILGFDNWVGGAHHFERLVKPFAEQGLDLQLLHLGSWGNDVGRPVEETMGALKIRDISIHGSASFPDVLRRETPDLVLFMSTDTFSHRAFNRYCRQANVPTMHVYHGIMSVQPIRTSRWKVRIVPQLLFALGKIPKALRRVWPCYAVSLLRTGASPREWHRFLYDILMAAAGRWPTQGADDARTDRCCVLAPLDIAQATDKYRFAPGQVTAVGLPDLISFGIAPEVIGWGLDQDTSASPDVMYVDTGFIFSGGVYASPQAFIQHLVTTQKQLNKIGKKLLFKPHPDFYRTNLLDDIRGVGIEVCEKKDFVSRLQNCCAAIVETSSASIVPAILGLPTLLAKYGDLASQDYGTVLTSYPRARLLTDISQIEPILAEEAARVDAAAVRRWILENAGPFPAEDMPLRVAQVTIDLIDEFRRRVSDAHAR